MPSRCRSRRLRSAWALFSREDTFDREMCNLADTGRGREVFDVPHPDDFPIRLGESVNHLQQNAHQLPAVLVGLGVCAIGNRRNPSAGRSIRAVFRGQRNLPVPPRRLVHGFVPYDLTDPGACRRLAAVPSDPAEHGDPAFLQGILRGRVVACHTARDRQEPGRATPDPFFVTTVEERALDGVCQRRQRRPEALSVGRVGHRGFGPAYRNRLPRTSIRVRAEMRMSSRRFRLAHHGSCYQPSRRPGIMMGSPAVRRIRVASARGAG